MVTNCQIEVPVYGNKEWGFGPTNLIVFHAQDKPAFWDSGRTFLISDWKQNFLMTGLVNHHVFLFLQSSASAVGNYLNWQK